MMRVGHFPLVEPTSYPPQFSWYLFVYLAILLKLSLSASSFDRVGLLFPPFFVPLITFWVALFHP